MPFRPQPCLPPHSHIRSGGLLHHLVRAADVPSKFAAAIGSKSGHAPSPAGSHKFRRPPPSKRHAQQAEDYYLAGARLLDNRNLVGAEHEFAKALKLSPSNHDYIQAVALAREHRLTDLVQQAGKARILGQNAKADELLAEARIIDPQNSIIQQHMVPGPIAKFFNPHIDPNSSKIASISEPIALKTSSTTHNFHLHTDSQDIIRQVASAYGIRVVFDESVQHQNLRFDLDNATYQQAMHIVLEVAQLFAVPLDANSILIATDTPENRQRLERQVEETIYMPGLTKEQMGEISNVVKNVFDLKQVTAQNSGGTLVVRTPAALLNAINYTLADLIDGGSEVMIDVKLYAVDKNRMTNIGLVAPQQIGIYNVESSAQSLVTQNQSLVNQAIAQGLIPAGASYATIALYLIASGLVQSTLLSSTVGLIGGGLTQTGVTTNSNLNFNLALNSSDTRALDDIQVRVGDKQTATFRAGSKYPITTSTYSSGISSAATSALAGVNINGVPASTLLSQFAGGNAVTVPMIQYEDLGVTMKATPAVQKSGRIAMHIDLKIEALSGDSIDNIPILASRQFVSDVSVPDGQTALIASSVTKSEASAVGGYPGLAELPGFQQALSDKNAQTSSSELVILVTPHVVRRRSDVSASRRIVVDLPIKPD